MRRLISLLTVLLLCSLPVGAQVPMTGAGLGVPSSGGGGTTTFDLSNKGSNITLSGGNLIATTGASGSANTAALSVASHSSGKFYLEFKFTNMSSGNDAFGIANSSFLVASDEMGFNTANRSGAYWINSGVFIASSNINTGAGTIAVNDWIAMAVDRTAQLVWYKDLTSGGNWNGAPTNDPATGVGGVDISLLGAGAYFAGTQLEVSGNSVTVNFGGSAYVGTPPAGFGNW